MPADPRRLFRALLDAALPPLCPGCDCELRGRRWLCGPCRSRLRPAPGTWICFRCRSRERMGGDREAGMSCLDPGHRGERGRAAWWMEPPLDRLVHALKYGGRDDLARPLGGLLARRVALPGEAVVASVPLHRTRLRERGYNQAALLARWAAVAWGAQWEPRVLERSRATRAQARLTQDRRARNVSGAFRVPAPEAVRGRTLVLVDDVGTTGSTLVEAARALAGAGAERVVPVVLALA